MDSQPLDEQVVIKSVPHIGKHNLNSSDALYLEQAVSLHRLLQPAGHQLLLVASDRRLLRAALGEGLATLDVEAAAVTEVDPLIQIESDQKD